MKKTLYSVLLMLFISVNAIAWNHGGHMAIGAIAYTHLKANNPKRIPTIVNLLKLHPDFILRWKHTYDSVPEGQKDITLFMLAARWPDDIKSWYNKTDRAGSIHRTHHYIDNPVSFDASPTGVPGRENILTALEHHISVLDSESTTDAEAAISLCWVFHLVGDLYQPLHNVSLFSTLFPPPHGDHGGNDFIIDAHPDELHAFWDDVLISESKGKVTRLYPGWFGVVEHAVTSTMSTYPIRFDADYKIDFRTISMDAVQLAIRNVYQFNGQPLSAGANGEMDRDGNITSKHVPAIPLPEGYLENAKKIAGKQISQAGATLAEVLNKRF